MRSSVRQPSTLLSRARNNLKSGAISDRDFNPHYFIFPLRIIMLASTLLPKLSLATEFTLPSVFALCACVVTIFLLLPLIYNRYFHPLRKFPGPFWGSLMDVYHTYLMWRKSSHTEQLALHKKHGQSCCYCFPSPMPA